MDHLFNSRTEAPVNPDRWGLMDWLDDDCIQPDSRACNLCGTFFKGNPTRCYCRSCGVKHKLETQTEGTRFLTAEPMNMFTSIQFRVWFMSPTKQIVKIAEVQGKYREADLLKGELVYLFGDLIAINHSGSHKFTSEECPF